MKSHYAGRGQYYVELPYGSHAVVAPASSPMTDMRETACGVQVMQSFLADPSRAPDSSCADTMAPVDFFGLPQPWLDLSGIESIWDGPPQVGK